jgi:uncharacterized repeat protein (TIGR01451 family)
MSIAMSLSKDNLEPMESFTCTISFDNTGTSSASLAWINLTLPVHVLYISDNSAIEGGLKESPHNWRFTKVQAGVHSFGVELQMSPDSFDGEIVIISGHLDYFDNFRIPMLSSYAQASLRISTPEWDLDNPASIETEIPVGITKGIVSSNSTGSIDGLQLPEDNGEQDDIPPEENLNDTTQDPLPPPTQDPGTTPPGNDENEPGKDPGEVQKEPDDQQKLPGDQFIEQTTPVATIEVDDGQGTQQTTSYADYDAPTVEETKPAINPTQTKAKSSRVSSEIVSNNKVYDTGDLLSFTIFLNNTGSQTAGQIWVELTIPSTVMFIEDTSALIGGKTLGELSYVFTNVRPGNHEFLIYLSFEGEAEESTEVEVWVHVSYTDSKGDFVGESSHRAKCAIVTQPDQFPLTQVSIVLLSAGLLSVVAYSTKEWGTASLLPFIAPLYSRLKRREILNHEARGMIIGYIKENPGEHFNSLKSKLDFRNGTLAHHLHILERERVIKSVRYGKYRRFFPIGMMVSRKAYPTELEQEILEVVRGRPGINQKTIAKRVGRSKSTVNYHIDKLRRTNRIRTEKNGLSLRHYTIESE